MKHSAFYSENQQAVCNRSQRVLPCRNVNTAKKMTNHLVENGGNPVFYQTIPLRKNFNFKSNVITFSLYDD